MTKIVVIEDQQVLATVYRNKFLAEGYQVEVASDGEAGLALINIAKPDLVLLDVMLPNLNGIEVLKRVRANSDLQNLPVIIFSNVSLPGRVEEAWKAGATMVLSKSSVSPKQIVESVRTALKTADENRSAAPVLVTNTPAMPESIARTTYQRGRTPGNILLIEDHPDMRALISFQLDQAGHQVTCVESNAAALHQAKLHEFSLFLINRVCPDGSGLTLCRKFRESFVRQPVVMYSSVALPTEQQSALDAGAVCHLSSASDLLNIGEIVSQTITEWESGVHPARFGTQSQKLVAYI